MKVASTWISAFVIAGAAQAQLQLLPDSQPQAVFGGGTRTLELRWRNAGDETTSADISARMFQASSATVVPLGRWPWKNMTVQLGQTVLQTATLDFPAVRAETPFLIQWLDGTNTVLGKTEVRVFPTNLLARLQTLAGEQPVGVFDPDDLLKSLLRPLGVLFQDLAEDGTDKFTGRLTIFGPFDSKGQMRTSLTSDIRALAKRGVAVVWLQPPPGPRDLLRPSFYSVRVGDGAIVVAQVSLVARLADSPEAQSNLLRLAELALRPAAVDLPDTETSN